MTTTNTAKEIVQTPSFTAAEVRELLEALRAEYRKLPPAARLQVRNALAEVASAAATMAEKSANQGKEASTNTTMIGFGGLKFLKLLAQGNG